MTTFGGKKLLVRFVQLGWKFDDLIFEMDLKKGKDDADIAEYRALWELELEKKK